jgi:hypothetical protein
MKFWEVKFTFIDYDWEKEEKREEVAFFETLEECMAFIMSNNSLDIKNIEFKQRSMGICKREYTLNRKNTAKFDF